LEVVQAEAADLPFPDEWFDIATSRMSVMYFTPLGRSLREIRRVLKPRGRISLLAWGMPEQGTHYASCLFPFLMRSTVDPPAPEAPSPFRFSPPGSIQASLVDAGFNDVTEMREIVEFPWPGPPEELWQHVYETTASLRRICDSLSRADFEDSYEEAIALLHSAWDGKMTTTTAEIVVGSASK
jgi:SAM-dependent methyltransferase